MIRASTLTVSVFAMLFTEPRMSERKLADIAVVSVPRMVKEEIYKGIRLDQAGRLTFSFASTYFWASFGSGQAYKHQLFVSLMAPDATDAEYKEYPRNWGVSYDKRAEVRSTTIGSGRLVVYQGIYTQNALAEPAHAFFYTDRSRRLLIAWHAVKKEISLDDGIAAIGKMASSFRIVREPTAEWAEMRDMPRKAEEEAARKRALIAETLVREGYGKLVPGKPVMKGEVYVEWMADPEPRIQLLLPLGRVRFPANAGPANRPRPVSQQALGELASKWSGSVGWREFRDGEWTTSNSENAYLPFEGIAAKLAEGEHDPEFVEFYYSATVRVEEVVNDRPLSSLQWFFDDLPEVRRAWSEGRLTR